MPSSGDGIRQACLGQRTSHRGRGKAHRNRTSHKYVCQVKNLIESVFFGNPAEYLTHNFRTHKNPGHTLPYTQTHNTCEDPAHTWQIRLRDSTAKLTYEPQKDGPEQHLGLDIVQDLLQYV